jgi:putative peptidoglycan lipid II flippase
VSVHHLHLCDRDLMDFDANCHLTPPLRSPSDRDALRRTASLGLRSMLFLVLPVSAGFVVFATPLIRLVFERGEFGPGATEVVAACLAAYAVGLVPMAGYYIVTRTFYALQNMRTPVAVGGAMVLLNAVLAYALMKGHGVPGIALATALVAFVNLGLLLAILHRTLGPIEIRRIANTAVRTGASAAVALAAGWWATRLSPWGLGQGRLEDAVRLAGGLGAAAVLYLAGCLVLRVDEMRLVRDLVRRRSSSGGA